MDRNVTNQDFKISRRNMIFGSLAVAAMHSLPSELLAQSAPGSGPVSLAAATNIGADHPEFQGMLAQHFPGFANAPTLASLLPHARIFQNNTGQHLRAVTIEWTIPSSDGSSHTLTAHYMAQSKRKLDMHKGFQNEGRAISGRRTIVRADNLFIATPLFLCSAYAYNTLSKNKKTTDMLASGMLARKPKVAKLLALSPSGSSSTGVMKAVVLPHGMVQSEASPAVEANLLRRFFNRSIAEHDEAEAVLRLLSSGHPKKDLRQALERRVLTPVPKPTAEHPHIYLKARKRYARHILSFMKHHGIKRTVNLLTSIANVPRQTPYKLSA